MKRKPETWTDRFIRVAELTWRRNDPINSDDIVDQVGMPDHYNMIGVAMKMAVKRLGLRRVGRKGSRRGTRKNARISIWI